MLLPGFEKNDDRLFKDDFNSLMDYTLHFAKAVILAVDDACIANEEIDVLIEKLGRNFNPNNCVFAITKTEGASAERCSQLRDSLRTACEAAGLKVGNGRIVCTGNFRDPKNNDPWIETLLDAAGDSIDYTAEKKDYIYFQPMLTEMWECAQQLQKQVELAQFKATSSSHIYEPLKKALEDAESHLGKALDEVCDSTKKEVSKQFVAAFDAVDAKHKKNKKWFFLEKKYAEIEQDRQVLERACMRCLTDPNSGKSVFVKKAGEMLNHGAERTRLLTAHDEQYEKCIGGQLAELNERQMQVVNDSARFFLDPAMKSIPHLSDVHQPELSAIANLIATEFEGFYIGMLGGDVRIDSVPLRVTSMGTIMREAKQTRRGTTAAAFLTMADLLDGKADILEGAVSLFVNDPAKVGAVVSAGCTAAAAAIAVVVAARKGIAVYNHQIRSQNAVGEAWRYALLNAVDEQKNDCLDSFREAGEKLLNYVDVNFNNQNLCLTSAADYLETSIYVVSRLFKEATGKGFKEYVTDKRLEYARELLETTNYNVSEISAMAGFENTVYFSNVFKAKYGLPPTQYRKKHQE